MTERQLTDLVANYLQIKYPNIIYRFDYGADLKMTIGQATRMKKLHGKGSKGFVDLFIYEARHGYFGLGLELKVVNPYKKNGEIKKNEHLQRQGELHQKMSEKGYFADFVTGWEEVKEKIDWYLNE